MPAQPLPILSCWSETELAILRSVLYAALFDYPLTLAQLRQSLTETVLTPTEILTAYEHSAALRRLVEFRDGFFYPRGRADLPAVRRRREVRSRLFLRRHRVLLALVCAMPYVRVVALSGSIAHLNLDEDGDLDLFVVTRRHRVWMVAVAVVLLAKLLRRRRNVCANLLVDEDSMALDQQDLFTANQIIHLKALIGLPLFHRFLASNAFVRRFYPNFHTSVGSRMAFGAHPMLGGLKLALEWLLLAPSAPAERLCRWAYGAYLRRGASTWASPDQVRLDPGCLKLHTASHRHEILARFDRAVEQATGDVRTPATDLGTGRLVGL